MMEERSPFTHILVPVDGSESSINAGRLAIQIAATHNVRITFVCVVDRIIAEEIAGATSRTIEVTCQELENKGQHYLDYLCRLASNRGLQADQVIRRGIPHREIADLARELGVDLIAIGRVGRHGPHRVHIGSVAERVIESAPCPVLVVRHTAARR
jgi:nucleotide-binding universal stress UspA family protein